MNIGSRIAAWFGGKKGNIPSDCVEVEWIEINGGAYLDTKIVPNIHQIINLSVIIADDAPAQTTIYSSSDSFTFRKESAGYFVTNRRSWVGIRNTSSDIGTITIDSLSVIKMYVNRVLAYESQSVYFTEDQTDSLLIGKRRSQPSQYGAFRLKYFQMEGLDLVPVRCKTDGLGYMCDKLTGTLYGNAGDGAFIIGPDKLANGGGGIINA